MRQLRQQFRHPLLPGLRPLGAVQPVVDGEQTLAFERGMKKRAQRGLAAAPPKTSGITMVALPTYAVAQRPSLRAASTWAKPAACMRPCSISRSACCTFFCAQLERARRGVMRCKNEVSSKLLRIPSIQPQAMAATTQSSHVTLGWPLAFLKIRTHSSVSLAWLACSHAWSCSGVSKVWRAVLLMY